VRRRRLATQASVVAAIPTTSATAQVSATAREVVDEPAAGFGEDGQDSGRRPAKATGNVIGPVA